MGTLSPHSLNHFLAAGFVKSIVAITLRGGKSLGIELLRREGHALHAELGTKTVLRAVPDVAATGASTSRGCWRVPVDVDAGRRGRHDLAGMEVFGVSDSDLRGTLP